MTHPALTAVLCFALGAWYSWQLNDDVRWRERECRAANAQASGRLVVAAALLTDAREKLDEWECSAGIWQETASWYQAAYLQCRGLR
jgi:hypothetical protein